MRPNTVEKAMPKIPHLNTNKNMAFKVKLVTLEHRPAHIVERVSWWAFTSESGKIDQKEVKAEPSIITLA